MITELHMKVLKALGFEIVPTGIGKGLALYRNDQRESFNVYDPDKAWAQAPTLESLALPLMTAMTTGRYGIEVMKSQQGYTAGLVSWEGYEDDIWEDGTWAEQATDYATITDAIAALFVAACDTGLIKGTEVVL